MWVAVLAAGTIGAALANAREDDACAQAAQSLAKIEMTVALADDWRKRAGDAAVAALEVAAAKAASDPSRQAAVSQVADVVELDSYLRGLQRHAADAKRSLRILCP